MERFLKSRAETTDAEIAAAMRRVPGFVGVFDRTQLAKRRLNPGQSAILNIDGAYAHGGTHWTAVVRSSEVPLYFYFCSYGGPPVAEATLSARRDGDGILYSDVKYQKYSESNCGQRAAKFVLDLAKARQAGRELETFLKIAGKDVKL